MERAIGEVEQNRREVSEHEEASENDREDQSSAIRATEANSQHLSRT